MPAKFDQDQQGAEAEQSEPPHNDAGELPASPTEADEGTEPVSVEEPVVVEEADSIEEPLPSEPSAAQVDAPELPAPELPHNDAGELPASPSEADEGTEPVSVEEPAVVEEADSIEEPLPSEPSAAQVDAPELPHNDAGELPASPSETEEGTEPVSVEEPVVVEDPDSIQEPLPSEPSAAEGDAPEPLAAEPPQNGAGELPASSPEADEGTVPVSVEGAAVIEDPDSIQDPLPSEPSAAEVAALEPPAPEPAAAPPMPVPDTVAERSGTASTPLADGPGPSPEAGTQPEPQEAAAPVPGLPIPGLPDPDAPEEDSADEPFEFEDLDLPVRAHSTDAPRIAAGSRCTGTIVAVAETGVIVSFGAKVEGQVPIEEFRDSGGEVSVQPGDQVEVVVERLGAPGKYAALSYRRARESAAWKRVEAAHANHEPLQAKVVQRIRGGLRVDIGIAAFLPGSQVDIRPVRDLDAWVGETVDVLVVECNRRRSNAVVSRSELLKTERESQLAETLARLEVGEATTGVVKNITTYGVFVDLGGIDGLIKLTELSYGRIGNPSELLEAGQEVTAKVLRIDAERGRVALSLRAMQPDPWATIGERYKAGDRVQGRVSSVTDYGAFVALESGVEGLIHISEIDWSKRPKHPSKTFSPGAETEAVVLDVKPAERRISLSFRRLVPDPWDHYASSLEPGLVVEGVVRRVVSYGLFVEVTEGLEGLVHVSDLSWDSRARDPHQAARKGQKINTVILKVDVENRRLSLGVKQLEPDSWDAFLSQAAVGDSVPGLVRRLVKFGAFVELAPGVEGLCHSSQCPKGKPGLQAGSRYRFEILDVNERARRIGLRCHLAEPLASEDAPEPQP